MKIIIISILTLISTVTFSQGNLQFNQVKLVSSQETVPVGKVWKVESVCYSAGPTIFIQSFIYASMSYAINGNVLYIATITDTEYRYNNPVKDNTFPFWLPAGSTLSAGTNMKYLSIIEFSIIPL